MERETKTTRLTQAMRFCAILTAISLVAGCGGLASPAKPVSVQITSPIPSAEVTIGISTYIMGNVTGDNITRVDVEIDGQAYAILTADDKTKGMPSFPVQVPWAPSGEGLHVVQLIVYGPSASVVAKSDPVIFKAVRSGAAPAPTQAGAAAAQPVPTNPAPTAAAPTAIPLSNTIPLTNAVATAAPGTTLVALTATATLTGPGLTIVNDAINIRSGPGTTYDLVGQLAKGATAAVRGKSADGTWWQIDYPSAPGGLGWVFGELVQANTAAADAPVVNVPPPPTGLPVTVTPALPSATPTPTERPCDAGMLEWFGKDPHYPFCVAKVMTWYDNQDGAHRYENGHDVPVSFSWDIWGVDGIWIVFEQDNSGYCGYTKQAAKTINERVDGGYYAFNVKDFPGGATMRIHLNVKRKDGQVVEFGDKRLCIF
ncbi:MAG: SH3 domain-containing protein [Chloroflexi bacterium]|nr:SH3 domain-containing protein [Chloroflexota bacterium]